jgi:Protein of unknown function (DUF3575)
MRFHRLIFTVLIFFIAGNAWTQPQKNNFFIRTNLLSFIDPYAAGPTMGMEYFLTDHLSLGTDVGIILYDFTKTQNDNLGNPNGYKIKPEIRYYLYKENTKKRLRLFISLEGLFLKTTTNNYNSLAILDNTGNVVYNYLGGYQEVKKVKGAVTKCGLQIPRFIFENMIFEVYAGVGVRDKQFSNKNIPAGARVPDRSGRDFFNLNIDGLYPSLSAGFKLVYKIR